MKNRRGCFAKFVQDGSRSSSPLSLPLHPPSPPHTTARATVPPPPPPRPKPEVSAHPGTGKCEVSGASVSIKGQDAFRDGQQPGFADWSLSVLSTHTSGTSGSAARKQRVYLCRRCPLTPPPHLLPPRSSPSPPPRHVVHLSLDNVRLPIQRPADDKLFSRTGGEYTGNDDYGDSLVLQDSTEIRPCRFANSEACMMRLLSFFCPPPFPILPLFMELSSIFR